MRRSTVARTALLATASVSANPIFNSTYIAGTPVQAIGGFAAAAARWSAIFTDDVTLNMTAADFGQRYP
jgi:hypothetical protein